MGNSASRVVGCFVPVGSHRDRVGLEFSEPLDDGLGHSFCYVRPVIESTHITPSQSERFSIEPAILLSEPQSAQSRSFRLSQELAVDGAVQKPNKNIAETTFKSISGASVSANTSTPRTVAAYDQYNSFANGTNDRAAAFESTPSFSAIPLQPVPRGFIVQSGPISGPLNGPVSAPLDRGFMSGPIERGFASGPLERGGFMSGPLEKAGFISGPLENIDRSHFSAPIMYYRKRKSFGRFMSNMGKPMRRALSKTLSKTSSRLARTQRSLVTPVMHFVGLQHKEGKYSSKEENNFCDSNLDMGFMSSEGDYNNSTRNLQWAQGKAGEDRVHVVLSEEHGWLFVGIYDGFNGPDAPDFLMSNLYRAINKELEGLLWDYEDNASLSPSSITRPENLDSGSGSYRGTQENADNGSVAQEDIDTGLIGEVQENVDNESSKGFQENADKPSYARVQGNAGNGLFRGVPENEDKGSFEKDQGKVDNGSFEVVQVNVENRSYKVVVQDKADNQDLRHETDKQIKVAGENNVENGWSDTQIEDYKEEEKHFQDFSTRDGEKLDTKGSAMDYSMDVSACGIKCNPKVLQSEGYEAQPSQNDLSCNEPKAVQILPKNSLGLVQRVDFEFKSEKRSEEGRRSKRLRELLAEEDDSLDFLLWKPTTGVLARSHWDMPRVTDGPALRGIAPSVDLVSTLEGVGDRGSNSFSGDADTRESNGAAGQVSERTIKVSFSDLQQKQGTNRSLFGAKLRQIYTKRREIKKKLLPWRYDWEREQIEVEKKLEDKLTMANRKSKAGVVDHVAVLNALARALEATEGAYLEMADKVLDENPELALMGSCVVVMLMKDQDVYVMNLGDSRAILAQQRPDSYEHHLNPTKTHQSSFQKGDEGERSGARDSLVRLELERIIEESPAESEHIEANHNNAQMSGCGVKLNALQLSTDHSTSIEEFIAQHVANAGGLRGWKEMFPRSGSFPSKNKREKNDSWALSQGWGRGIEYLSQYMSQRLWTLI
eukprot:Gb_11314 [translate_table: standard]